MLEFFVPLKSPPTVTHQQKKVTVVKGKPIFYEPEALKSARSLLMAHLGKHVPFKKATGPVRLYVKWLFPMTQKSYDGQYKDTRPDVDNSQKLLFDCMTDLGFWEDDSQVVSLIAEKFWAETTGIYIKIEVV